MHAQKTLTLLTYTRECHVAFNLMFIIDTDHEKHNQYMLLRHLKKMNLYIIVHHRAIVTTEDTARLSCK